MTGEKGYELAREYLRKDFSNRCSYCMIHEKSHSDRRKGFEIDHFKPLSENGDRNVYENLYLSCSWCNRWKSSHWPKSHETKAGMRFADPCGEHDYGVHFVENADGHLDHKTPCGEYHVRVIRLNRNTRKKLRIKRNRLILELQDSLRDLSLIQANPHQDPTLQTMSVGRLNRDIARIMKQVDRLPPFIPEM